jgi:DNA mismatch repair ATPase MutS
MARGDEYLRDLATRCLLVGLDEPEAIRYRQAALRDCLAHPAAVRELYSLAVEALDRRRLNVLFWGGDTPEARLHKSLNRLELLAEALGRLRALADEQRTHFPSAAFTRLFATVESELDDEYLRRVEEHRKRLRFQEGVLMSAELGAGSRGTGYVLRKASEPSFFERLRTRKPPSYSFTIPARDEHGLEALSALRDRGINLVATALGQSTDHLLSFFRALRAELGFYVACLNLYEALAERGQEVCFPEPLPLEVREFSARELYDVALAFHLGSKVVGSDVAATGKELVVITGANQGGKSTFLRSVGLAQLMMQAGMFVGARELAANVCAGLFTHYKREEDASMDKGKLDEELARMSAIADSIAPDCVLLCNESFASTNEREGSEIGRQVVSALLESGVKVFFVTHLYDLARSFCELRTGNALFLRAQRGENGRRPFRLEEGAPLPTSFGEDSFKRIFGRPPRLSLASRPSGGRWDR